MSRYESSGSSVQTEIEKIFPPENTRLYTRYFTEIMIFCFVIGTDLGSVLKINGKKEMSIADLKDMIYKKKKNSFKAKSFDSCDLNLWLVDIPYDTNNFKLSTLQSRRDMNEENIIIQELGGKKLTPVDDIGDIFTSNSKNIRIIVQPPTTVSSTYIPSDKVKSEIKNKVVKVFPHINILSIDQLIDALALIWVDEATESEIPSSQNDPCVKLRMEPSFFKINLPSAITKQSATPVNLCLPPYKSKSGMNYLNPFYDDPQFKKTVSLVREKLIDNPKDITVLAGVSGGGKTSTAFGISIQHWTIYVDFDPTGGQYGDSIGHVLETTRTRPPKYGETEEQGKVFDMLDLAIISRGLLLIKLFIQGKISTPKEWLFAQLRMNDSDIQDALGSKSYKTSTLINKINACLNVKSLILIFDEAQVLCGPAYGEYDGSSLLKKKWNLLQAYIEHLTHLPVTCLIAGTYMHMASGVSLVTSVGKVQGSHAHIVLKLPFLSPGDVMRNLKAVIDLTDITPKTLKSLKYVLKGRPRNCASFVQKLISERESTNRTKDQEMQELLRSWVYDMILDMADYFDSTSEYVGANDFNPEKAIMDVLRLRVFYNQKHSHAIELLKHSIIPCKSPECIILSRRKTNKIKINIIPKFESFLVSSIEEFFLRREKTLIDVFVDNIITLNDISSIGNEFDAVFITAIIQKRGLNVREELNKWTNGQQFDLPPWITSTMKFKTCSNLSGTVSLAEYVSNENYRYEAIQPEIYSGSDLVLSLVDDKQNVVLLSASCTVSGSPIKREKVKEQLFKSCMKFQYMECPRKRKKSPCLQIGLGDIPSNNEEDEDDEDYLEEDGDEDDLEEDEDYLEEDVEEDEDDLEDYEDYLVGKEYGRDLNFDGVDYDLNYIENTKNYRISHISKRAENHEKIKTSTKNRRHIYVSVELPCRQSERSRLFRINEYGDLVIIVDDRNVEHIFGPAIKKLVERISYKEDLMDETE